MAMKHPRRYRDKAAKNRRKKQQLIKETKRAEREQRAHGQGAGGATAS